MADKILSPDGKQEWNGTEWVPLSDIAPTSISGTDQKTEAIVNYAHLCLDSLNGVDMARAKTYYERAKEVDLKIAKRIFEGDYGADIGRGYAGIVETNLVRIVDTNFSANMDHFGSGVVNWDIDGDHEMDFELRQLNMAFDNAVAFLGDPESMIKGGGLKVKLAYLESFDEDGDGVPDITQREITTPEVVEKKNCAIEGCNALKFRSTDYCWKHQDATPPEFLVPEPEPERKSAFDIVYGKWSLTKEMIEEIEFTGAPDEEISMQQYRIGLLLIAAGSHIDSKLSPVLRRVMRTASLGSVSSGVTLKILQEKIVNAAASVDKGRNYHFSATAVALNAGFPVDKWESDDFEVLHTILENSLMISKELHGNIQKQQEFPCFIATAAYGTPFDSKIDVLRNWRDDSLESSKLGRLFIRNYYFFSPPIASIVAKSIILRGIVRFVLSPIIHLLEPKYSRPRTGRS